MSDLALGVRLAVGGGRTSLARFALSTVGIGIAAAVLLVATSLGSMMEQRELRMNLMFGSTEPVAGVDPLAHTQDTTTFRGEDVEMHYVHPTGPDSPEPPGLRDTPGPGEMYVSPALHQLLTSDEGELLRPRFADWEIVGEVGKLGVREPGLLIAWMGADESLLDGTWYMPVYQFGDDDIAGPINVELLSVVLIGAVVLLLPIFIFVSSASRIAGAERDRRLSALRLVGSGSRQVRRIAAAESLVSALAGLGLGAAVFLVARRYAEDVELFGIRVYTSDIVPSPLLVLLVVVAIPALAVLTALFALRRTIIEPLGVVRHTKPVRRRAWWRFAMIVAGVALLLTQLGADEGEDLWAYAVAAGATLVLIGVPVLLPWLVERVVGRVRGGPSSWQLAIRRLQLDSGTSARVVGGVAVVLAGAIALQTVLMTVENDLDLPPAGPNGDPGPGIDVSVEPELAGQVKAAIESAPGVRAAHVASYLTGYKPGDTTNEHDKYFQVMDCAGIRATAGVDDCVDGGIYEFGEQMPETKIRPGEVLEFREYPMYAVNQEFDEHDYDVVGTWTVPDSVHRVRMDVPGRYYGTYLVTPGALAGVPVPGDQRVQLLSEVDPGITSDQLEGLRNAVAPFSWRVSMYTYNTADDLSQEQQTFLAIRTGLYIGSVFTLMLAGVSLLVLALEHIRERRRPLAVLAASGVPRSVLARSLLWQIALPIGLGVVVAMITGIGLAYLMMRLSEDALSVDWAGVASLTGGALVLSLLVSALTLPFLRSATRLTTLRME